MRSLGGSAALRLEMGVSGMVAGGGVPRAVAMEEQKKKRAGAWVETDRENWTRLWTPLTCWSSKLRMHRRNSRPMS